jgi:anti-sigma B factor antagonist
MKFTLLSAEPPHTRIRLEGDITMTDVPDADKLLEEALGSAGYRQRVLMDLEHTSFIDSSGISWMLICHKHFVQAGGQVVYHSAPPLVQHTLNLLRLNLVMHLAADEDAARKIVAEGKK